MRVLEHRDVRPLHGLAYAVRAGPVIVVPQHGHSGHFEADKKIRNPLHRIAPRRDEVSREDHQVGSPRIDLANGRDQPSIGGVRTDVEIRKLRHAQSIVRLIETRDEDLDLLDDEVVVP